MLSQPARAKLLKRNRLKLVDLTKVQQRIVEADGHILVTGGPGSGKTTVSILKAAKMARERLRPGQQVLFLSFARATVSRVMEAIGEERNISPAERAAIDVDTYHSFFWRILKAHGYLTGLPRKLVVLTPPNEAIALSGIRSEYKTASKLTDAEKAEKLQRENAERIRLAKQDGRVCFDLFASSVSRLLHGSARLRELVSTMYPAVVLDEFQDTNLGQWDVVRALGLNCTLIALADPEQRIYDFIGADPARLDQFRAEYLPAEFDLGVDNHRSRGTDILAFGNDILKGQFRDAPYNGIDICPFESNLNQAFTMLFVKTIQARKRLLKSGKVGWSLAILCPTKKMMRQISDAFRDPGTKLPVIAHSAAIDMEAPILAAEIIAFLMQQDDAGDHLHTFIELVCSYFSGKGGDTPTKDSMKEAGAISKAHEKYLLAVKSGKSLSKNSIFAAILAAYDETRLLKHSGDPDIDWVAVRTILEKSACPRMNEIALEVRNIRLLERGTQLRQALSQDWRDNGAYRNALVITRQAFVQEHFASAHKPENGVVVMNMHKAKGKQFDEVIIFEGWPRRANGEIVANLDRIVRSNSVADDLGQAKQNFRVSVTRSKLFTTILTPRDNPCVLLPALK